MKFKVLEFKNFPKLPKLPLFGDVEILKYLILEKLPKLPARRAHRLKSKLLRIKNFLKVPNYYFLAKYIF